MTEKVRLQKFLSECGIASRRKAEKLITAGKIRVNGQIAKVLGTKVDPINDKVQVKGQLVRPAPKGVILLHKPRGVVCTLSDPEGRATVADYLTKHYRSYFPVGRLDVDSSGLIILTNDGDLADRLLHPRFRFERRYVCEVAGSVSQTTLQRLTTGVRLEDGMAKARARILDTLDDTTRLEIVVLEGRNKLIRRMMKEVGHPVKLLKRVQHGPFKLGSLKYGEIKRLSEKEYSSFREKTLKSPLS